MEMRQNRNCQILHESEQYNHSALLHTPLKKTTKIIFTINSIMSLNTLKNRTLLYMCKTWKMTWKSHTIIEVSTNSASVFFSRYTGLRQEIVYEYLLRRCKESLIGLKIKHRKWSWTIDTFCWDWSHISRKTLHLNKTYTIIKILVQNIKIRERRNSITIVLVRQYGRPCLIWTYELKSMNTSHWTTRNADHHAYIVN